MLGTGPGEVTHEQHLLLLLILTETWPIYHSPWIVHLGEHEELAPGESGTYRDKLLSGCMRSVCLCVCVYYQGWSKRGSQASRGTIQTHHFGIVLYILCMYVYLLIYAVKFHG